MIWTKMWEQQSRVAIKRKIFKKDILQICKQFHQFLRYANTVELMQITDENQNTTHISFLVQHTHKLGWIIFK